MAVKSNSSSFSVLEQKHNRAKSFKERLDILACPYTEGVEESWITELIFKPGEPRIRLLQWLFSRFDSSLNEVIDPQYASAELKMDSRIQRLLFVASTLGLCRRDDVDLIRGATSASKQSVFMDKLVDLVCIQDAAEDPQTKAMSLPGIVSDSMTLDEQLVHDCQYVDSLVAHEKVSTLFNSDLQLIPPDLQRKIEVGWLEKGHTRDNPPQPDFTSLQEKVSSISKDLDRQKDILEEMKKKFKYEGHEESQIAKVSKKMELTLTELSQLVVGFSYCYENEMSHWCHKSPPNLTQLGPLIKRVSNLQQMFASLVHTLQKIRSSHLKLGKDIKESLVDVNPVKENSTSHQLVKHSQSVLERLQNDISILENAIHRREMSFSFSSMTNYGLNMSRGQNL